eukprot:m.164654 g.164654  ORF g.164654 m.164654 type:complete len:480 (+) comp31349_c0_seq1:87-1526(+)
MSSRASTTLAMSMANTKLRSGLSHGLRWLSSNNVFAAHTRPSNLAHNIHTRLFHSSTVVQETYPIRLPALSPTMTEGTIVRWFVAEGGEVATGDTLFEMETDKAVMAVEATEDGFLSKIVLEEGTGGIPIGALCGLMVEEEGEEPIVPTEDVVEAIVTPSPAPSASTPAPTNIPEPSISPAKPTPSGVVAKPLSPAVLAMVNTHRLDASLIVATGPKGHILKGDVLAYLAGDPVTVPASKATKTPQQSPQTSSAVGKKETFVDIPTTNIRKVIARRLTESKSTIPHSYSTIDVNMSAITSLRVQSKEQGIKFSFNDAIIKSAALALRTTPAVNAMFTTEGVVPLTTVDISVAVATPTGLITPIVTGADGRGMVDISTTVKELAGRAREGKLQPHEFQGGTFSVSNLGMMGVSSFSAVINPPQACILAVGATKPKINADFTVSQVATFTLSSDARVVDDEDATLWLTKFKTFMENPATLL